MAFPSDILEDIERGYQYLSNLNVELQGDLMMGCKCSPNAINQLSRTLTALDAKVELDEYDDVVMANLKILYLIIGDSVPEVILTGYWWFNNTGTPLTEEQILSSNSFTFIQGADIPVPFNVTDYSFYGWAYPSSEGVKNYFQDASVPDNKGYIGMPDELMGAPVITGQHRQFNTNYPTLQTTNLIFSSRARI